MKYKIYKVGYSYQIKEKGWLFYTTVGEVSGNNFYPIAFITKNEAHEYMRKKKADSKRNTPKMVGEYEI